MDVIATSRSAAHNSVPALKCELDGVEGSLEQMATTGSTWANLKRLRHSDVLVGIGQDGMRNGYLGPHYGVQNLPESLMGTSSPSCGSIRARLNEWVAGGAGLPENMKASSFTVRETGTTLMGCCGFHIH